MRPPPGPYSPGSLRFGCDGSEKPRLSTLAAAGGGVVVGAGLVEHDHDQPVGLVCGRGHDLRDPQLQERVDLRQPARAAVLALGPVVAVVARVRGHERVVRGRRDVLQVGCQWREGQHMRIAQPAIVDDRREVHERVVPGRVAVVGRTGRVGQVDRPELRMAACRAESGLDGPIAMRVIAHVLGVLAPAQMLGAQLRGDRRDVLREHAAAARELPELGQLVEVLAAELDERREDPAVLVELVVAGLAGDLRDVVVKAVVTGAVVVADQRPPRRQRLGSGTARTCDRRHRTYRSSSRSRG